MRFYGDSFSGADGVLRMAVLRHHDIRHGHHFAALAVGDGKGGGQYVWQRAV